MYSPEVLLDRSCIHSELRPTVVVLSLIDLSPSLGFVAERDALAIQLLVVGQQIALTD